MKAEDSMLKMQFRDRLFLVYLRNLGLDNYFLTLFDLGSEI